MSEEGQNLFELAIKEILRQNGTRWTARVVVCSMPEFTVIWNSLPAEYRRVALQDTGHIATYFTFNSEEWLIIPCWRHGSSLEALEATERLKVELMKVADPELRP